MPGSSSSTEPISRSSHARSGPRHVSRGAAGEEGLAGWTIYIDENNNNQHDQGEVAAATGSDGGYAFKNLMPGTYTIRELIPADSKYYQTAPAGDEHTVTVTGTDKSGYDFGNVKYASLTIEKYEDKDGNGVLGASETTKLSGFTFGVDLNGDSDYDDAGEKQTTGADGSVVFDKLKIGADYTLVAPVAEEAGPAKLRSTTQPACRNIIVPSSGAR